MTGTPGADDVNAMDLHHLRHFAAVAEALHFGRAAARLDMAQPALSQSIQRLEATLGTSLFIRSRHGVALTPAGNALLPHARETLLQAELAERAVQRAARGEFALLRVGFVPWSLTTALPRALCRFRRCWPGVQVRLYERVSRQQVSSLRKGELDLALISLRMTDTAGLETRIVERSRLVVAVPAGWPLAARSALRLSSSRLTREISNISASPWRVASTCSEVTAANACGTYTVRLRPSPYTVRYAYGPCSSPDRQRQFSLEQRRRS